jgi:hypothetical protein
LYDLIHEKLQPLIGAALEEFHTSEEYKSSEHQQEIINDYTAAKDSFENKYGEGTYHYCYAVFGVLRNVEYLKELEDKYKVEYENTGYSSYHDYNSSTYHRSNGSGYYNANSGNYKENDDSSYYDYDSDNCNSENLFGSYRKPKGSNSTEADKKNLKKIYKVLVLRFHPDRCGDDGEFMRLFNRFKEEGGFRVCPI